MPQTEPKYSCSKCERQNLTQAEMVFTANSHDPTWRPWVCRDCEPLVWAEYHRASLQQREREAKEIEERRAGHQPILRQVRARSAEALPFTPPSDAEPSAV